MTVKDLIAKLQTFPENLEVLEQRYSDFQYMDPGSWQTVEAMPYPSGGWVQRAQYSMTEELKAKCKTYVVFWGN
jgi:hypothetical protein